MILSLKMKYIPLSHVNRVHYVFNNTLYKANKSLLVMEQGIHRYHSLITNYMYYSREIGHANIQS